MANAKTKINGTIAPLGNVARFTSLLERVMNRPEHLPGMATFYGPSGFGKTFSATYGAHRYQAYYVEVGESWTKKRFLQAILVEIGLPTNGNIPDLVDRIIEALAIDNRPLIVDEFDHVIKRNYIETVREIHDKAAAPIILIGEELMPSRLSSLSERFHNRILDQCPAQPCDLSDVRQLARLWCPQMDIADDLLQRILDLSHGRVRRVCVNLDQVREAVAVEGLPSIDLQGWGNRPLFTGAPPASRRIG